MGVFFMKLELIDNTLFKTAFESISKIVDEVVCNVDSEGFYVNAIDRSHICFVQLTLHKELFDSFSCDVPEKICLDTIQFMQILKRIKKTDVLGLSIDENNLVIDLKGVVDKTFKIRLIDVDYETQTPPSIPFDTSAYIESSMLKDALGDMELFADSLNIKIDEELLSIFTDGEFGDANFEYLHGEKVDEVVQSSFSINKLKDILSASGFSEFATLSIGNDMPLKIVFRTLDENGELSFLLAPKINQED